MSAHTGAHASVHEVVGRMSPGLFSPALFLAHKKRNCLQQQLLSGDSSSSRSAFMDGLDAGLRDAPPSISFAAGQELARVLVKKATGDQNLQKCPL